LPGGAATWAVSRNAKPLAVALMTSARAPTMQEAASAAPMTAQMYVFTIASFGLLAAYRWQFVLADMTTR
jgi:hypothetical protein